MSVTLRDARLDDRYTASSGPVLLSGIQALVRLMIEQRRLDLGRGLNSGMLVSGYPGSPLGGLDREIVHAREHPGPLGIGFRPGANEELAATAVAGTQLVAELPGRTRDGVTGLLVRQGPGARSRRRRRRSRCCRPPGRSPIGSRLAMRSASLWRPRSTPS